MHHRWKWLIATGFLWVFALGTGTSQVSIDPMNPREEMNQVWRCKAGGVAGGAFGEKSRAKSSAYLGCKIERPHCQIETCWTE